MENRCRSRSGFPSQADRLLPDALYLSKPALMDGVKMPPTRFGYYVLI